jgi:hypothetical protein
MADSTDWVSYYRANQADGGTIEAKNSLRFPRVIIMTQGSSAPPSPEVEEGTFS